MSTTSKEYRKEYRSAVFALLKGTRGIHPHCKTFRQPARSAFSAFCLSTAVTSDSRVWRQFRRERLCLAPLDGSPAPTITETCPLVVPTQRAKPAFGEARHRRRQCRSRDRSRRGSPSSRLRARLSVRLPRSRHLSAFPPRRPTERLSPSVRLSCVRPSPSAGLPAPPSPGLSVRLSADGWLGSAPNPLVRKPAHLPRRRCRQQGRRRRETRARRRQIDRGRPSLARWGRHDKGKVAPGREAGLAASSGQQAT